MKRLLKSFVTLVANNFLVYTNAKVGLGAYQNSDASAVTINGGLGYRFK
jgi:hypothetical protein